jgi:adenosylmethionine-8-amino-7-oxononanoate aminotransferase
MTLGPPFSSHTSRRRGAPAGFTAACFTSKAGFTRPDPFDSAPYLMALVESSCSSSTTVCASAQYRRGSATLDLRREEGLFERARALEPIFADAVNGLKGAAHVIDIRALDLAAGIDLAPIDGSPGLRGARALDDAFFDEDV